ncbi:hypothetical protein ACFE04_018844 [Oxalis oulophora]
MDMYSMILNILSAWLQVSHEEAPVTAIFTTVSGFIPAGAIVAEANCWSMLKGGLTMNVSGLAQLYFKSKNTSVEIWVDSISLQPFTEEKWKSHQDQVLRRPLYSCCLRLICYLGLVVPSMSLTLPLISIVGGHSVVAFIESHSTLDLNRCRLLCSCLRLICYLGLVVPSLSLTLPLISIVICSCLRLICYIGLVVPL